MVGGNRSPICLTNFDKTTWKKEKPIVYIKHIQTSRQHGLGTYELHRTTQTTYELKKLIKHSDLTPAKKK